VEFNGWQGKDLLQISQVPIENVNQQGDTAERETKLKLSINS